MKKRPPGLLPDDRRVGGRNYALESRRCIRRLSMFALALIPRWKLTLPDIWTAPFPVLFLRRQARSLVHCMVRRGNLQVMFELSQIRKLHRIPPRFDKAPLGKYNHRGLKPIPNINASSRWSFSRSAVSPSAQRSAATPRSGSLPCIEKPSPLWTHLYSALV